MMTVKDFLIANQTLCEISIRDSGKEVFFGYENPEEDLERTFEGYYDFLNCEVLCLKFKTNYLNVPTITLWICRKEVK